MNLGTYKAGASVFYAANFHNDQGTIEDPTSPEAQLRDHAGTWSALTAPAKQNSKTGHYGGTVDTTGFTAGQHIIRMQGTVATAKVVATEFCFQIEANNNADIYTRLGTPAGASVIADLGTVSSVLDGKLILIKAVTDQFVFTVANRVDSNALSGGGLDAAGVRAAVGLASANLDTQIGAKATQISVDAVKVDTAASKLKTDQLTFTVPNVLDANVQRINDVVITGDGDATKFGV